MYDAIVMDYMKVVVQKAKKSARGFGGSKDTTGESSATTSGFAPADDVASDKPADEKAASKSSAASEASKGYIEELEKFLEELESPDKLAESRLGGEEAMDVSNENKIATKKSRGKGIKTKATTKRTAKKRATSDDESEEIQYSDGEESEPVKPTSATAGSRSRRVLQELTNCEEEEF